MPTTLGGVIATMARDAICFPVWWYAVGLGQVLRSAGVAVCGYSRLLAISVWWQNLFVPMFGQYDWQSRLISFFMRVIQIAARVFVLVCFVIFVGLLLSLYVIAPVALTLLTLYYGLGGVLEYGL